MEVTARRRSEPLREGGCGRLAPRTAGVASSVRATVFVSPPNWLIAIVLSYSLACLTGCRLMGRNAAGDRLLASREMTLHGVDALEQGRFEEAEALFGQAIRHCSVDERARSGYAEALWQRGASDLAVAEMEKAVKLAPGNTEMLVRLGEMRLSRGDRDGALACAHQAIDRHGNDSAAWTLQGDVQRMQGELEAALASYHHAMRHDPSSLRPQLAAADIYRQQGRPQRMLATIDALADTYAADQVPAEVLFQRGLAQRDLGRFDDSVASLAAATKRGPASPEMLAQLAEVQWLSQDVSGAQMTATEASRQFPESPRLRQLVAQLESQNLRVASLPSDTAAARP